MIGLTVALVICLTLICLACLTVAGFMIWWTMDSSGQHSISAGKQSTMALASMESLVGQTGQILGAVTGLTETLLLGREMPPTLPSEPSETPSARSQMPADVWDRLPPMIQEALTREWEEAQDAGTWPDPSETLRLDSEQA